MLRVADVSSTAGSVTFARLELVSSASGCSPESFLSRVIMNPQELMDKLVTWRDTRGVSGGRGEGLGPGHKYNRGLSSLNTPLPALTSEHPCVSFVSKVSCVPVCCAQCDNVSILSDSEREAREVKRPVTGGFREIRDLRPSDCVWERCVGSATSLGREVIRISASAFMSFIM